jgi:flagellar protein FliO/FliZ
MVFVQFLSAIAALAVTLGLFGLAVWAWRRFAPAGLLPLTAARERRMKVVESLVLDAHRRLVLVSLDGHERLVLLGEGQLLHSQPSLERRP